MNNKLTKIVVYTILVTMLVTTLVMSVGLLLE